MMSVPAINSVLPPSGSQQAKINSSPTANPSVSPIGLSVPPKISVIPPPQISTSPNKPSLGVNHSSVPLSLVYENKVVGSQAQTSFGKPLTEKPKDLSPAKPTSNGVEAVKTSPSHAQQPQSSFVSNKAEDIVLQQTPTTNHSEDRIYPTSADLQFPKTEEFGLSQISQNDKIEQSQTENAKEEEKKAEVRSANEEQEKASTLEEPPSSSFLPAAAEAKSSEKPEAKVTPTPQANKRKREQKPLEKKEEEPEPEKKPRRIRSQVLPYQSPLPELATVFHKSLKEKDASQKNNEEKLIVFYKNEFLAVRNAEGGFYLCQTLQNVYRSSHRIRIRWLSQKKEASNNEGDIYTPDFYDLTDFECILTTVALNKMDKNMYKLPKVELERIENILKRALDVEKGVTEKPPLTEEHPDGIDLSLYKDESQLQKPKRGGKSKPSSPIRKSPKQHGKKEQAGEPKAKAPPPAKNLKAKSRSSNSRVVKKATKSTADKTRSGKRASGRSESGKLSKTVDQLKVSPPNEKARVVAKVLRKIDIIPAKETSKKSPRSAKVLKRNQEATKNLKKKPTRNLKKGNQETVKEEPTTSSHHERRQGKNKYSNNKNKKN